MKNSFNKAYQTLRQSCAGNFTILGRLRKDVRLKIGENEKFETIAILIMIIWIIFGRLVK